MTYEAFQALVQDARDQPVVVDVWAPWCGPCKMMKPVFEKLAEEYRDTARVVALNSEESPEVVEQLRISGVPTVVVFRQGQEAARRMGAQGERDLRALFEAAVSGDAIPRSRGAGRLALLAGAALAMGLSGNMEPSWPLQIAAMGLFVWAIHDRCPIIQALLRSRR